MGMEAFEATLWAIGATCGRLCGMKSFKAFALGSKVRGPERRSWITSA
jgi:hypothetical protein